VRGNGVIWEFTKRITLLKQRNWRGNRACGRGNGVFSGFTKRITLLKQRNWRGNRAPGAGTGCFGDLQNELRCKNNGIGEETARWTRKPGVFGNRKTNYVVKTTELGRKPRAVRGVLIFRSTAEKMGQAAACWRAKSADGGGNRRTSAKKNTRGRCGQQMESCAGGGTLSKKCAKNANWTGAAALSPRRRGYAAKIMRRKNARRKFGKRASGESHYRNPCGIIRNIWYTAMRRSLLSPFFHYYNIIVTFLICRVFFDRAPKAP